MPRRVEVTARGYKPKTVDTPAGALTLRVPKSRGCEEPFFPQSLERGRRSSRAVMLAIAQMYVQGASTRDAAKVMAELSPRGLVLHPGQPGRRAPRRGVGGLAYADARPRPLSRPRRALREGPRGRRRTRRRPPLSRRRRSRGPAAPPRRLGRPLGGRSPLARLPGQPDHARPRAASSSSSATTTPVCAPHARPSCRGRAGSAVSSIWPKTPSTTRPASPPPSASGRSCAPSGTRTTSTPRRPRSPASSRPTPTPRRSSPPGSKRTSPRA